MEKPFIPVLLGTNRKGRQSEKVAHFLLAEMKKREDLETALIDVKDLHFPYDDYGPHIQDQFPEFMKDIRRMSGLVIVTPEYNHSFPGSLKMALDLLNPSDVARKPVGLAVVSAGDFGGVRCAESLLPVLRNLDMRTQKAELSFPKIKEAFNEDGTPKDEKYYERVTKFIDELISYI